MTDHIVGSGQMLIGLVLRPGDAATVTSGGRIIGTLDGGSIALDGGRAIATAILSAGTEAVENGGSSSFNLVENGGALFVPGSGSISETLIERGGIVTLGTPVGGDGTGNGTLINGGVENLFAYSTETNDVVRNGGVQNLNQALVVVKDAIIDKGGEQVVAGQTFGTIVNKGGLQYVQRGDASVGVTTGTIINNGGRELLDGGISIGTVINHGGSEDVYSSARGTIINGGTMIVEAMAETGGVAVTGGVRFTRHHGALELAGTSLTTTTISGFGASDRIDLLNLGFSSVATASLGRNNVLTIRGLIGGTATLMLDPAARYGNKTFALSSDGHSGTNLIVQAASKWAPPDLVGLQAAATAHDDPLGLRAAVTKAATVPSVAAWAPGTTLPEVVGGSAHALALLMQTASAGHVQVLTDQHGAGSR